jgi:hypothetical protein
VFCFYKEQVTLLIEQNSIEIDMGFKRVRDHGITEIVLARFMDNMNKGKWFRTGLKLVSK